LKIILTILTFHFFTFSYSQDGLRGNHYAINSKNDTIRGFIEEIGETRITIASIVKNEYKVTKLSTKTIKQYNINDTIFRSVFINKLNSDLSQSNSSPSSKLTGTVFLRLIIDGPAALYERNVRRLILLDPLENEDAKGFVKRVAESELYLDYSSTEPALRINASNFYNVATKALGSKKRVKDRLNTQYYTFENLEQMLMDYNYLMTHDLE
jgi:hypothetical protein